MNEKFSTRFDELYNEALALALTKKTVNTELGSFREMDDEKFIEWKVKAKNLLSTACGKESQHFEEFLKSERLGSYEVNSNAFDRMKAVFIAAKEDYKGGYIVSFRSIVQADIFDSELEQAQELLTSGYKLAAAVIAGVVLETTLRDICTRNGTPISKLDKMNSDLAKLGIYNKLQQKRITALADIRNSAAHGKPEDFSEEDVNDMIRDVERFLANHLV